jgi:hypothetical protein
MNGNLNILAEALVFVHGKYAESEAARHALMSERMGDMEIAEAWREVQQTVRRIGQTPTPSAA